MCEREGEMMIEGALCVRCMTSRKRDGDIEEGICESKITGGMKIWSRRGNKFWKRGEFVRL